jgi:integrase
VLGEAMKDSRSIRPEDLLAVLAEAQSLLKQRERAGKKAKPRRSKKAPVSLNEEEILKMLAAARARRIRDWVLMLVTYRHGLRASEALNIRRRDLVDGFLRVHRGKGSEETVQPLLQHENPLLNEIDAVAAWVGEMEERGMKGAARPGGRRSRAKILQGSNKVKSRTEEGGERLFTITRQRFFQIFQQYAKECGIREGKRSPHKLKHSIVMNLLRDGLPPYAVRDWVGWKSMSTIDHYTRADADEVAKMVDHAMRAKPAFRRPLQDTLFGNEPAPARAPKTAPSR